VYAIFAGRQCHSCVDVRVTWRPRRPGPWTERANPSGRISIKVFCYLSAGMRWCTVCRNRVFNLVFRGSKSDSELGKIQMRYGPLSRFPVIGRQKFAKNLCRKWIFLGGGRGRGIIYGLIDILLPELCRCHI